MGCLTFDQKTAHFSYIGNSFSSKGKPPAGRPAIFAGMKQSIFRLTLLSLTALAPFLSGIAQSPAVHRIVSVNGTVSSMLCDLGLEQQIVGVDVTSTWPASLKQKPQVGHNRNVSAEGIMALQPTLVLGTDNMLSPQLEPQLTSAGINTQIFKQTYSIEGTKTLLKQVAAATGTLDKAAKLLADFDKQTAQLHFAPLNKKVLFLYARGAGMLLVSGTGTPIEQMILLAGASNAISGFKDYKPLSTEALIAADPDVILLFDSGLQSIGGVDGLLKIPGVSDTKAGKNKAIISMDGELLSGWDLRVPQAVQQLHQKIAHP